LLVQRHASLVAREEGVSFAKVWRLADRDCIELTEGQEPKGYWRLSPTRRAAMIEARHMNPDGTQQEIARAAGVSRATVSRIERADCHGGAALAALVARRMVDMPTL
jgi:DNA-binding XRE family transcriptional regulator